MDMRFSLGTLIILIFWIGSLMAVWMFREPWVLRDVVEASLTDYSHVDIHPKKAPDNKRGVTFGYPVNERCNVFEIADTDVSHLCLIDDPKVPVLLLPLTFLDDDTLELLRLNPLESDLKVTYRRRFPEWWWGHFYRPEVWLAVVLTALLGWRIAAAQAMKRHPLPYAFSNEAIGPSLTAER